MSNYFSWVNAIPYCKNVMVLIQDVGEDFKVKYSMMQNLNFLKNK